MKRRTTTVAVLGLVTAAAVTAAIVSQQSGDAIPREGEPLVAGLLDRVNDAQAIVAVSQGQTFEVEKVDGEWRVPSRRGYYADTEKIHQLVVGAAGLTRVEPKTRKPELYAKIGLTDPTSEDSDAVRYSVRDAQGDPLLDLVVGKREPAKGDSRLWEYYVRIPGDPQTWLVQGKIPLVRGIDEWTETKVLRFERARVHRARVEHPDGEVVEVVKPDATDGDFDLVGKPESAEIAAQYHVNDIGRGFAGLDFDEVLPVAERPDGTEPGFRAEMQTFDGLVVEMLTERAGDRYYATLSARFDPQAVRRVAGSESPVLASDAEVEAAVARYNERWSGWIYRLPPYRATFFARKRADLLAGS